MKHEKSNAVLNNAIGNMNFGNEEALGWCVGCFI